MKVIGLAGRARRYRHRTRPSHESCDRWVVTQRSLRDRPDASTLSRWRHGFESRWGCFTKLQLKRAVVSFSGLPPRISQASCQQFCQQPTWGDNKVIQKRGTRWRVVVQATRDPLTGRRRQVSGSAATRQEATRLEKRLLADADEPVGGEVTLAQVAAEYWAARPRLAPTTRLNYRSNLDLHVLPLLGSRKINEIRPRLVASLFEHLRDDKHLGPATVRKVRTVLSAVMSFAVAMEYAESNPVMKVPPPELHDDAERVAPTLDEAAAILLAAEQHDRDFLTYLWVAAEEGGRRGETLALRWAGVDFENRILTIDGTVSRGEDGVQVRGQTKTKKPRRVAVSAITLRHLVEHRQRVEQCLSAATGHVETVRPTDLVFSGGHGSRRTPLDGAPWRPDSTTRRFRRLKERAGVRTEIDLHGLRHTMITELLAAGVDPRTVMGRAGHASEAMTMKVYAKVRPLRDAAAAELWGQMLKAKVDEMRSSTSS